MEKSAVSAKQWMAAGYSGIGPVADLINSQLGHPALICGSASGVFEDYDMVRSKMDDDLVIFAVNDVGMYLPVLHHWVSLHSDNLMAWKQVRWLHAGAGEVTKYHSIDARPIIDYDWTSLSPLFVLSGYFAMQIAWIMGCSQIILAGCPGNSTPRFFEADARPNFSYGTGITPVDHNIQTQLKTEMARLPHFRDIVRSTSGWTREYFGAF